jgi:PBP1b-binding outer membrane lipoprotein LpoB
MKKLKIVLGATALAVAAVAILACSKEKTAQQETPAAQQTAEPQNYTLAEMIEAMSWEDGKAFFENQPIKDYTAVCEQLMNDCSFAEKEAGIPYYISWELRMPNGSCNPNYGGSCIVIRHKENTSGQSNAVGYFEDGKLGSCGHFEW